MTTAAGLVGSVTSDAESEGVTVLDAALSASGAVVDAVGPADPLGAVADAGLGWLLAHVSVLREPLDALSGDPGQVNANVDALRRAAEEMRTIAREHRQDLRTVAEWRGAAGETYVVNLRRMAEELESLGTALDGTAAVVGVSGMLVCRLRGIVFDLVSALVTELSRQARIAAAAAPATSGGSIAACCGVASARATDTAATISDRIGALIDGLGRQEGRLATLADTMSSITGDLDRFSAPRPS